MDKPVQVIIRASEPGDKNFIMASWLNGNRYGSPYFELQDSPAYFETHAYKIGSVLMDKDNFIRVACDQDNIDWIAGFAVFNEDTLHWIYVRDGYRNKGIAKLLLGGKTFKKISGLTKVGAALAKAKSLIFQPL